MCLDASEKSQKTKLGLLEIELQVTESPDGAGNQTGVFWKRRKISYKLLRHLSNPSTSSLTQGLSLNIELSDPTGLADQ